jgi:hypothetical protein
MEFGRPLTFQRNLLPPSSVEKGGKVEVAETSGSIYQATWHHIPKQKNLIFTTMRTSYCTQKGDY